MRSDHESEPADEMLRDFLRGQRESVLAIVEGLSEDDWHRSIVPTGWTPGRAGRASWRRGMALVPGCCGGQGARSCRVTSTRICRHTTR